MIIEIEDKQRHPKAGEMYLVTPIDDESITIETAAFNYQHESLVIVKRVIDYEFDFHIPEGWKTEKELA